MANTKFIDKPPKPLSQIEDVEGSLILHYNCRSIKNKLDEISYILNKSKPLILCLTETWLDSSCPQGFLDFQGYRHVRKDRSEEVKYTYGKSSGGGVAIIYRQDLKLQIRSDLNTSSNEILWVSTTIKRKKTFLAIVYRPQYLNITSGENSIECSIQKANSMANDIIVIGDFNIDLLQDNSDSSNLTELFKRNGLSQLISSPTRSDSQSESLIDHIWTSESTSISCGTLAGISDHAGVFAILPDKQPESKPKPIIGRSYRQYDPAKMQSDFVRELDNSSFEDDIRNRSVDKASIAISEAIRKACDVNAPVKEFKPRRNCDLPPWYTSDLIKLIEEKQHLLTRNRALRTRITKQLLKTITNKIKSMKRKLKKDHYCSKIEQNRGNSKKLWELLKEATRTKVNKSPTEPDNINATIANTFNRFFATVGKKTLEKLNITEPKFMPSANDGYRFSMTTPTEVGKLIEMMKSNSAAGHDNIPPKILKDLKTVLSDPLSKLINLSFEESTFPTDMKHAIVRPIYKNKGSNDSPQFYRPISILSSLSKIVERAAVNRLVSFFEENDKLFRSQHAYRKNHSTITSLVEITEYMHQEIEKKMVPALIATDLSKAFDSVSHGMLLQKLEENGIQRSCTTWIGSYLSGRTQVTKFETAESDKEMVLSGVPQGSILGPILFIIFTADLAKEVTDCKFVAYADDAALLVSAGTTKQLKMKIESNIKKVQDWYTKNGLLINSDKTEFMVMKQREKLDINIYNGHKQINIRSKECLKTLGMQIDTHFTWRKHIAQIKSRTCNAIKNIAPSNNILPLQSRIILTNALVVPHYNYGDILYDGCTADARDDLERNHNYAARALLGKPKSSSATHALNSLNWIPLHLRRKIHQGVFIHKSLKHQTSHHASSSVINLQPNHKYFTRLKHDKGLNCRQHTTTMSEKSTLFRSTHVWNSIPSEIRAIEATKIFKDRLQRHYIDRFHVGKPE